MVMTTHEAITQYPRLKKENSGLKKKLGKVERERDEANILVNGLSSELERVREFNTRLMHELSKWGWYADTQHSDIQNLLNEGSYYGDTGVPGLGSED